MNPQTILDFWFQETQPKQRFQQDDAFDAKIRSRFDAIFQAATKGELATWRETIHGRLAEIIVLDQFARNLFRNDPRAFAHDAMALALAQEAVRLPEFKNLSETERHFVLMPFMHSESRTIHEIAAPLFKEFAPQGAYDFELKHKEVIDRFGRYPHRNKMLGRKSTVEESAFLQEPGSSF